jgi:DNA-binding Lrp family transcriptional regulator
MGCHLRPFAEKVFGLPMHSTAGVTVLISFSSKACDSRITAASMNPVLQLLIDGGSLSTGQMAKVAGLTEAEVNQHLEQLKKDKIFLGWRPVLDLSREAAAGAAVRAVIEVRITPERGGGFNRHADRISRFDEVESCYLMSGGYDLLVFVRGASLQKVASFVSEKLSTIEGVLSTSTHFMLRCYKEQGFLLESGEVQPTRQAVAP